MNNLVFNIIYLPQTVRFQSIPLISLLMNTNLKLRLIGNGLDTEESDLLEQICSKSEQLEYLSINSHKILPHGTVLDLLFAHENSPYFCFMDPDIFAFKKLITPLNQLLGSHEVFSSCSRMENDTESTYSGFKGGATTISPDGKIPLASSFFCIYQRKSLQQTIDTFGVGFEQYRSRAQIPKKVLTTIDDLKLSFEMFDTGKLLGVLLFVLGFTKRYEPIDGLIHIGGMSGRYLNKGNVNLDEINLSIKTIKTETTDTNFNVRSHDEIQFKKILGTYFYGYLNHLIGVNSRPSIPSCSSEQLAHIKSFQLQIDQVLGHIDEHHESKEIFKLINY